MAAGEGLTRTDGAPDAEGEDSAPSPLRYSTFISYNHLDKRWATWLHRAIETYSIPAKLRGRRTEHGVLGDRLKPVFRDRDELATSADLAQSVKEALEQADALIVICSPNGANSRWVNQEIAIFTALGRRNRIQCLIVGGEPHAATLPGKDPATECFPPALFEGGGASPLAADVRHDQDSRSAAKLKIIASILGVGYDELRQRDQARQARRNLAIAGVLSVALVLMTGLSLYALASRAEAVQQRDIARRKTMTAERTVDFVKGLFEVADPSEARGDTITAREILDRGAVKVQTELNDEPSVKADLTTTLGEVYAGLGLYKRSQAIIQRAIPLANVDPVTRSRQYAAMGEAQARDGDDDSAVRSFQAGLGQIASGTKVDDQEAVPGVRARLLVGLGMAQSELNQNAVADRTLNEALSLDLRTAGPVSPNVARDLEELGYNDVRVRHYDLARSRVERALKIRLAAQGDRHPKVSEDLSSLGVIAYFQRDSAGAEAYLKRAMATDNAVLGPDHPDAATTVNSYARLLLERRDFDEAERLLEHVVAVVLRQRSDTFEDLAYEQDNLGLAKAGLGDTTQAESLFQKALRVARLHSHRNLAPVLADLADVTCGHDPEKGLALLKEAGPIMDKAYSGDPWRSAWVQVIEARCRLAQHDRAGAFALLRAAQPIVRARWPANSLYGARVDQLLEQAKPGG